MPKSFLTTILFITKKIVNKKPIRKKNNQKMTVSSTINYYSIILAFLIQIMVKNTDFVEKIFFLTALGFSFSAIFFVSQNRSIRN